jgi:hypothetical protein
VDVRLHGVEVGRGFRAQLDLTALHWSRRDTERFRPGADTQLYVWAAELARRDPGLALAFGRVRAWHAPGATIFDGAQVGWRSAGGSEVGIYAGGVPDPVTTSPTFARRTAGGYFGLQQQGAAAVFRQEGRVALVDSPELGRRLEAEVLGQAWLGRGLSAGAGVRFGLGDHQAPAALDVLRIDVSARLRERFGLSGSFRYLGLSSAGIPTTVAAGLAPSRHADLAATFDATRWLTVAASGGYARDVASGLERTWFGPEVSFPRLLGRRGGLSAGWHEERGWLAGRAVYLQAVAQPFDRWSLVGRASWFRDARPGPGADDDEVGLFASTRADLSSWLQFRLSVLGRMALGRAGPEGPYPSGVTGLAGFAGSY